MARSLKPYGPGTARFSPCMTWRYELTRDLSACEFTKPRAGILLSLGLNPSTATDDDDDPTIHKESGFAIDWGFATYVKGNVYAFRATWPKDMHAAQAKGIDIVGPDNDATLHALVTRVQREGGRVLAAWGQHIEPERQQAVAALLTGVDVVCVAINKNGTPSHPLYKSAKKLKPWQCPPLPVPKRRSRPK